MKTLPFSRLCLSSIRSSRKWDSKLLTPHRPLEVITSFKIVMMMMMMMMMIMAPLKSVSDFMVL